MAKTKINTVRTPQPGKSQFINTANEKITRSLKMRVFKPVMH